MRGRIRGNSAQGGIVFFARDWVLLFQSLLVGDRLLLNIFDVQWPPMAIIAVERVGRRLPADHTSQQSRQLHRIMDTEVEPEPAERVVYMRRIARKEDASLAE